MNFKLEISHRQNKNADNQYITYVPSSTAPSPAIDAKIVDGITYFADPFGDNTDYASNPIYQTTLPYWMPVPNNEVIGLDKIEIEWKSRTEYTDKVGIGSNYVLGASNAISFKRGTQAGDFVWDWLHNDINSSNNSIAVKLICDECTTPIEIYLLGKSLGQKWCNDNCYFEIELNESQEPITCFERTLIADNHQGWFDRKKSPVNILHPKYLYCDESSEFLLNAIFFIIFVLFAGLLAIEVLINIIINAINSLIPNAIDELMIVSDLLNVIITNIAGCRRQHPSPYLRTYFKNVCDKCGLTYNNTHDIFNSQVLAYAINDNNDPVYGGNNPYYNTSMMYPLSRKGSLINAEDDVNYIIENDPKITANYLADKLKKPFNANWSIRSNEFCFYQKENPPISAGLLLDFVTNANDKSYLISDEFCFEWDEEQQPAYVRGAWSQTDAKDSSVDKVYISWNDVIEWNKNRSENRSGEKDYTSDFFAPTSFRFDGLSNDYLVNSVVFVGSFLSAISFGLMNSLLTQFLQGTPLHAILLQKDTTEKARLIIHNTDTPLYEAESIKVSVGTSGFPATLPTMTPEPFYNTTYSTYNSKYEMINENNDPSAQFFPNFPNPPAGANWVYSHPLHYDADFKYTLYNNLHKNDDPYYNPIAPIKTKVLIKLCCYTINLLGVQTSQQLQIGGRVLLPIDEANQQEFYIWNIKLNNDSSTIELELRTKKYL